MDYLKRLEKLMARLRSRKGCPWDKKQTHKSLKPYLLEEAHEALEAIDSGDKDHLREELGDLLLQVVFHAQLAREKGNFDLQDVAKTIGDKLVRRHPHVFGKSSRKIEQINKRWEELKKEEKPDRKSVLEGLPQSLPALLRSQRIQDKISRFHFLPETKSEVMGRLRTALKELNKYSRAGKKRNVEDQVGKMLFLLALISHYEKINAEMTLRLTNRKFDKEFRDWEKRSLKKVKTPPSRKP
jgi:tetrapyrrole methylase family protein/MazG family protein